MSISHSRKGKPRTWKIGAAKAGVLKDGAVIAGTAKVGTPADMNTASKRKAAEIVKVRAQKRAIANAAGIARVQALWSSDRMSPEALRRRIENDAKWEAEHRAIGAFSGIVR
ncbi:hypothetical protein HF908_15125 [Ralstonia pseudosolanacearum]|uniref:Uncharacterized protein n=1 Tax=Ralstonia solanacearum TaxID=305 RepID=A0AA92JTQ4_RALSL|nr:hypothetical protein [Ralstonia pseudosolanacearum]QOK92679.1 hypothetical protein HF908_15125 [Ralstonia pseudosolanacearum]QOK97571.1 hypothetical protein HF909_14830 [Ralstonia pseudosolanacearum]